MLRELLLVSLTLQQSVDGIAGFLPRIVKNTKNLATLVLSDCYWIGRLAITSQTLTHFTLYKVVGLEMLQLKCSNLSNIIYNECNLSILRFLPLETFCAEIRFRIVVYLRY